MTTQTAFGPQGPNYATTRPPADPEASSGVDTWFKNCSAAGARDGTFATAAFFNTMIANLRYLCRTAGVSLSDTDDTMVYEAVQAIAEGVAGGGGGSSTITQNIPYVADSSTIANTIVANFNPAFTSPVSEGILLEIKVNNTNSGATSIQVNGLAALPLMRGDGTALQQGDIIAGQAILVENHGTYYQLMTIPWSIFNSPAKTFYGHSTDTIPAGWVNTYASNYVVDADSLGVTMIGANAVQVPLTGTYLCIAIGGGTVANGMYVGIERFSSAGADLGNIAVYGINATGNYAQANGMIVGMATLNGGDRVKTYLACNSVVGGVAGSVSVRTNLMLVKLI